MTGQNRGNCTRSSSSRFLQRLGGLGAGAAGNVSVCGVEEFVQTSMFQDFPSTPPDLSLTPDQTRRHLTHIARFAKDQPEVPPAPSSSWSDCYCYRSPIWTWNRLESIIRSTCLSAAGTTTRGRGCDS